MIESEPKIQAAERLEKEKKEEPKKKFFSGLKSRFLAFATAGFLTLGGGWEKGFADQLKIKIPDKKGAPVEFVLETAITDEKLTNFKEKIIREEPEFARWIERYIESVKSQLDELTDEVLDYDLQSRTDLEKERNLRSVLQEPEAEGHADYLIEKGHRTVISLKKKPEILKKHQEFLKSNLDTIAWGIVFMADSEDVRNNQIKFIFPPEINLSIHDLETEELSARVLPERSSGIRVPQIDILPSTFEFNTNDEFNLNLYVNIIIHELIHALNIGSGKQWRTINTSSMHGKLKEGITQNIAFEVVQYLGTKHENIKPIVSVLGRGYDIRLILAAILESIFRSRQYGGDTLAKWHTGIINNDDYMLNRLSDALRVLNLDSSIVQDINGINNYDPREGESWAFRRILIDILAKLRLGNVNLSPEFLKAIIANNRRLDDWQVKKFEETIQLGSIETGIQGKVDEIKQKKGNARY